MREETSRDGFDEDAVVVPDQVQPRVFRDKDLATLNLLSMEGIDIRAGESGHDPESWRHGLEVVGIELAHKELVYAGRVVECE